MNTSQLVKLYGNPGENLVYCNLPYPMKIAWLPNKKLSKFLCHKSVKDNIEGIFRETLGHYGILAIQDLGLDIFGGCWEVRPKKGGKSLSLHSWGLAIDIDPLNNQYSFKKDKAKLAGKEYKTFWNIVYAHKGFSLGIEKNIDWMHFQFIKI